MMEQATGTRASRFDVWVDFRKVTPQWKVLTTAIMLEPSLRPRKGRTYVLGDAAGHRCLGKLVHVQADVYTFELDVMNFRNPGE